MKRKIKTSLKWQYFAILITSLSIAWCIFSYIFFMQGFAYEQDILERDFLAFSQSLQGQTGFLDNDEQNEALSVWLTANSLISDFCIVGYSENCATEYDNRLAYSKINAVEVMYDFDTQFLLSEVLSQTLIILLLLFIFFVLISFIGTAFLYKNTMSPIVKILNTLMVAVTHIGDDKVVLCETQIVEFEGLQMAVNSFLEIFNEHAKTITFAINEANIASESKSIFLSNMSHELRTPLNSIILLTEHLMQESKKEKLTEGQEESLGIIIQSAYSLLELIGDILDLSKIESGKMETYFEEVLLSDLIRSVTQPFFCIAESKGLEFDVINNTNKGQLVTLDVSKSEQIFRNLLSNAFKFTDTGTVSFIIESCKDGFFSFSVKDTGIGVKKEKLSIIFNPFEQVEGSLGRSHNGSGLGLSITKKLIELHNGTVAVESEYKKGTTFTVKFPLDCSILNNIDYSVQPDAELDTNLQPTPELSSPDFTEIEKNKYLSHIKAAAYGSDYSFLFRLSSIFECSGAELSLSSGIEDGVDVDSFDIFLFEGTSFDEAIAKGFGENLDKVITFIDDEGEDTINRSNHTISKHLSDMDIVQRIVCILEDRLSYHNNLTNVTE